MCAQVDAGKTLLVRWIASEEYDCSLRQNPEWIAITTIYKNEPKVSFSDVNLQIDKGLRISLVGGVIEAHTGT